MNVEHSAVSTTHDKERLVCAPNIPQGAHMSFGHVEAFSMNFYHSVAVGYDSVRLLMDCQSPLRKPSCDQSSVEPPVVLSDAPFPVHSHPPREAWATKPLRTIVHASTTR